MSGMSKSQTALLRIAAIMSITLIIVGVLLIVDEVQREALQANTTDAVEIQKNTQEFKAYDVDGLSDEEIKYLLNMEHSRKDD